MTATLIAYRTPPQSERKAAQEAREAGHRAYLPREPRQTTKGVRRVPTARGYVFCEGKPSDAEHIKGAIGPVSRTELRRLYVRTSKTQRKHKFSVGQKVTVAKGQGVFVPAVVCEILGRGWYSIGVEMMGKLCQSKKHEKDIATDPQIRYEPG